MAIFGNWVDLPEAISSALLGPPRIQFINAPQPPALVDQSAGVALHQGVGLYDSQVVHPAYFA